MKNVLTIEVKSGEKSLNVLAPSILKAESLTELEVALENAGVEKAAEYIFKKASAQLLIDFRAFVRSNMDATVSKDDKTPKYTDETIINESEKWSPTPRENLTPAERAKKLLASLDLDQDTLQQLLLDAQNKG